MKSIYYELVFQKLDNYREWVISDWEKKVICEHRKNTCGECIDKALKIDSAYVIATNVNIRNKPNVSESKVLFQLNKVEWYKMKERSRYAAVSYTHLTLPTTPYV